MKIKGEDELIFKSILDSLKIDYVREYKFHPTRRFRFDFAILSKKIAFEIDGGIYTRGRHTSPIGYCNDCIKQSLAAQLRWRIIKIPTPWLHHHKQHKKKKHLMTYSEVVELVKDLTC